MEDYIEEVVPEEPENTGQVGPYGPVDISSGTFEIADAAEEYHIPEGAENAVSVILTMPGFDNGTLNVFSDGGTFHSPEGESTFMKMQDSPFSSLLGGLVEVGVNVSIGAGEIVGDPTMKIGEWVLSLETIADLANHLTLPGLELGSDWANTTFRSQFVDGQLGFFLEGIPVYSSEQIQGQVDIGLVNGQLEITGHLLVQVGDGGVGMLNLTYVEGQGFSGDATVQFSYQQAFGTVTLYFSEGGVHGHGSGEMAAERIRGTVNVIFGRRSYVEGELYNNRETLMNGGILNPAEEIPAGGNEEDYVVAGSMSGAYQITPEFEVAATGILDADHNVIIKGALEQTQDVQLTSELAGGVEMGEQHLPVFTYGLPLINIGVNIIFNLGAQYTIPALVLRQVNASGFYSTSDLPWASELAGTPFSLSGALGIDSSLILKAFGTLGVAATANAAGNHAEVGVNAEVDGTLAVEQAELTANMEVELDEEGNLHPAFDLEGDFAASMGIDFSGSFFANVTTWGHLFDVDYRSEFGSIHFDAGSASLHFGFYPGQEDPFTFGPQEGKDHIFNGPDWQSMLKDMHEGQEEWMDLDEGEEVPADYIVVSGEEGVIDQGRRRDEDSNPEQEPLDRIPEEIRDEIDKVETAYMNDAGEIHEVKVDPDPDDEDRLKLFRYSKRNHIKDYAKYCKDYWQGILDEGGLTDDERLTAHEKRERAERLEYGYQNNAAHLAAVKKLWVTPNPDDVNIRIQPPKKKSSAYALALEEANEVRRQLKEIDPGDKSVIVPNEPLENYEGGQTPTRVTVDYIHTSQDWRWNGQESKLWGDSFRGNANNVQESGIKTAWGWLAANNLTNLWVAYHVLHFAVGGSSNGYNLIAALGTLNDDYEEKFERTLQSWVDGDEIVSFEANIGYHPNNDPAASNEVPKALRSSFPRTFSASIWKMSKDGNGNWQKGESHTYSWGSIQNLPVGLSGTFKINDPAEYNDQSKTDPLPGTKAKLNQIKKELDDNGAFSDDASAYASHSSMDLATILATANASGNSTGLFSRMILVNDAVYQSKSKSHKHVSH